MASCPACSRSVVPGQRYCLGCGLRIGPPIVDWRAAPRLDPPRRGEAALAPPHVPRPKTAAALVLAALGAGTVLGAAAAPAPSSADAAPVIAYAPPVATATPSQTPTATPAPASGSSLPDDVPTVSRVAPEPTATPTPAAVPHIAAATPAPTSAPAPTATPTPEPTPPAVKHVVIVSLTGHHYAPVFGDGSTASYLAQELPAEGTLLARYHGVPGDAMANALTMMAGVAETSDDSPSLPYELGTVGKTWKAYVEGATATCLPSPRDPFPALPMLPDCHTADLSLASLVPDLAHADTAPSLAYVIPTGGHDGSDLTSTDAWLRTWIPKILGSEAFADDGLLVVLFDGDRPDAEPDKRAHVGAVVVSRFVRKGAVSERSYDHLSLARTLAAMLGVDPPGAAAGDAVTPFGLDVFRR